MRTIITTMRLVTFIAAIIVLLLVVLTIRLTTLLLRLLGSLWHWMVSVPAVWTIQSVDEIVRTVEALLTSLSVRMEGAVRSSWNQ